MDKKEKIAERESELEARLLAGVKEGGGLCYKFVSPGNDGVPDRIVVTPNGKVWFVELKTRTGRLSPMQKVQLRRLRQAKANAAVLYGREDVEEFLCWEVNSSAV